MNLFSYFKIWRILPQIILIAVLPALAMFVAVLVFSYYSRVQQVTEDMNEKGVVTAALVADLSEYAVASGDLSYLNPIIKTLLASDPSVVGVQIIDAQRRQLIQQGLSPLAKRNVLTFSALIDRRTISMSDQIEYPGRETASGKNGISLPPIKPLPKTIGVVTLLVDPNPLLKKQHHRLLVESLIATAAFVIALLLGAWLATRITKPLTGIIATVGQIQAGNYELPPTKTSGGEVGQLQNVISVMAARVDESRRDLESKVAARTSELRRVLDQTQHVIEEERRYISRELHDHLNAQLIVIRLEAQQILTLLLREPALKNMDELHSHATAITNRVSDLYGVARGIVRRLRPEILETLGLLSALDEIVKSYDETLSGCTFDLDHEGDFTNLNDKVAIAAYRCIQEGLSNIVRHAHATHAKVYLLRVQEFLLVNISDDGQGFTPGVTTVGVGLIGMRERINALRGSFEIASSPGKGTAIRIRFIT